MHLVQKKFCSVSRKPHFITQISQLMMFRQAIAVYSENQTIGQLINECCINERYIVTTVLKELLKGKNICIMNQVVCRKFEISVAKSQSCYKRVLRHYVHGYFVHLSFHSVKGLSNLF